MPAQHRNNVNHAAPSALVAGAVGGLVVAAFVVDPLFGLAAVAIGGGMWYKKRRHHAA